MKRKEVPNLTRKVTVRFQPAEYKQLYDKFKATTCRKFSEYVRDILLNKPVTTRYRNQSADEFLSVALQLKNELSAIGNNYNQAVKKLHLLHETKDMLQWILSHEKMRNELDKKVNEINAGMEKIYQIWLLK